MQKKTVIFGLTVASLFVWLAIARAAVLESPAQHAILSGLGFISGWKCPAGTITVTIDEGEPLAVAQHQERGDLRPECGTIHHGFIKQINWALFGAGEHVVVAYDDGVEFGRSTFTVGTTGEEFLKDAPRRAVVLDFPAPGEHALVEWNESTQHFEIETVWDTEYGVEYDRSYWRQYTEDQAAGTYRTDEFLYAERPALATCFAGRLTYAAKTRALEAANQIRALHGLPAVIWRTGYSQQLQEASLIQAAAGYPGHYPEPSARCYTPAGAEGSRTSNLGVRLDPAAAMVAWTNDAFNRSRVAAVGHRRWVLDPGASYFAYGQVYGYAAQKVLGYDRGLPHSSAGRPVRPVEVEFVAFPYAVYPFPLVVDDPPWSFSVIDEALFQDATITVTRVEDGTELPITNRYTEDGGFNVLSWQVQGWEYDTPYEVEIAGVTLEGGSTRDYVYAVFIERANLEE